jgi:hypothetical protein
MATTDDTEHVPQTPRDVAKRVLAIIAVVEKAHNVNPVELDRWVTAHRIHEYLSPLEAAFFGKRDPSQQEIVTQSWRAESLVPLLWALGLIDELPPLNLQFSWQFVRGLSSAIADPEAFIRTACLRSREVLDEAEAHLYHQHWRVRDAQLFGKPMPEELDPGIVYERRYGASWLVGWSHDWDNVPTDT